MTVLIGTDFSSTCKPIADVAAELARRRGEELVVAHVADGRPLSSAIPSADFGTIEAEARRLRAFGCKVRPVLLRDGSVGKRLAELAEADDVSVLVVGAQGNGLRSLLGTVATSALRHVARPVLVVRRAELLWSASACHHLRALVPFALDSTDAGLREALALVASTGDMDVDFVHYQSLPAPVSRRGPAASVAVDEASLRSHLGPLPVGVGVFSISERDAFGRLDVHLSDFAREKKVDLIVCGSHHRHGIERMKEGSVAEGMALHAPVSVLVGRAPSSLHERRASTTEAERDTSAA